MYGPLYKKGKRDIIKKVKQEAGLWKHTLVGKKNEAVILIYT